MTLFRPFLLLILLALAGLAHAADVRKCVDTKGKVVYVDGPCPKATQPERLKSAPAPVAPAAKPKIPEGASLRYYDVEGIEYTALLASLGERGPNGQPSQTEWRVLYAYRIVQRDGRCGVGLVETQVKADILMPRWERRHGASADLIARWEAYQAKLLEHEEGHIRHAHQLAAALEEELPKIPHVPNCRALDAAVRARYEELKGIYERRDKEYDAQTQHGKLQGAVFR